MRIEASVLEPESSLPDNSLASASDVEPTESPSASTPTPHHRSVMMREVLDALAPREGSVILDGTAGAGGHLAEIARRVGSSGLAIGLDRDPRMLELAERAVTGLPAKLAHASYAEAPDVLAEMGVERLDGVLLDLGLSSDQLAWEDRGFSFATDGPLDMRFDPRIKTTAADLVNRLPAEELANVIYEYGEERFSRRIARKIVETRRLRPILTTAQLADLVRRVVPRTKPHSKRGSIDPATRTFQALRIRVNQELDQLEEALAFLAELLKPGGRAVILSFHSLEDRMVKNAFRSDSRWKILTKKPLTAAPEEIDANPRARSAKLRAAERCAS